MSSDISNVKHLEVSTSIPNWYCLFLNLEIEAFLRFRQRAIATNPECTCVDVAIKLPGSGDQKDILLKMSLREFCLRLGLFPDGEAFDEAEKKVKDVMTRVTFATWT